MKKLIFLILILVLTPSVAGAKIINFVYTNQSNNVSGTTATVEYQEVETNQENTDSEAYTLRDASLRATEGASDTPQVETEAEENK